MYKLLNDITNMIRKLNENGFVIDIPINLENVSYQEYLKWVAEGNEPLPADE